MKEQEDRGRLLLSATRKELLDLYKASTKRNCFNGQSDVCHSYKINKRHSSYQEIKAMIR